MWLSRSVCGKLQLKTCRRLFAVYSSRGLHKTALLHQVQNSTRSTKFEKGEIRKLLSFAGPEKWRLAGAVGLLFVSSSVMMAVPYAIGRIIDIIYESSSDERKVRSTLNTFCKGLAVIFVASAAANFGRVYLIQTSGQRIVRRLRANTYASIMKQETAFFDKNRTGELINRLSNDTLVMSSALTQNISDGLRSGVSAVAATGMMLYTSPKLAMVGMAIVPFVGIMSIPFGRYIRKLSKNVQDALAESTQVAEEKLSNVRTVRAFGKERQEIENYKEKVDNVLRVSYKESLSRAVFFGLTALAGNSLVISVMYYGGTLVSRGDITVGQLSSFMIYVVFVGTSVNGLSSFYTELMKGLGASSRLMQLANRKPSIPLDKGLVPSSDLNGDISLNSVEFSYPSRSDIPIFKDLNLKIPAGKVTAVVGPSGSGKSSIAALILRLYDIDRGSILLDGHSVKDLNPLWIREHIGTVAQEPVLFATTIRNNISYGAVDYCTVTDEEIQQAAEQANAWRFIQSFPDGLDTVVGERGVMLSGGQKQRVAIARALLNNPHVLILDEATSALDSESEHLVQQALQRLMVGRTVIVIAHRLSTIRNAHNIVVLADGRIIESGTYDQLLNIKDGHFQNLIQKQALVQS